MTSITLRDATLIAECNPVFNHLVVNTDGVRVHTFTYGLAGTMDFVEPIRGNKDFDAHELRAITFVEYPDGKVDRFLMLKKFFGYNSTIGTMKKDLQNKTIISAGTKLDGSLARFIYFPSGVRARTSKHILRHEGDTDNNGNQTRETPHAVLVQNIYDRDENLQKFILETFEERLAAIFEYESPEFPIVVKPSKESLRLIQLRNEDTGEYLDIHSHPLVVKYGIECTDKVEDLDSLEKIEAAQANVKGIEGWVVTFPDRLVKFKTRWYEDMHDITFEGRVTEKTLLSALLSNTLDDVISHFGPGHKHYEVAKKVLDVVGPALETKRREIKSFVKENMDVASDPSRRKELAASLSKDDMYLLTMAIRYGNSDEETLDKAIDDYFDQFIRNEGTARKFMGSIGINLNKKD